ncbi:hypothetical protein [Gordonia liuliyuniae]|uniref:hypothetical protein n=1 Tax=Gordonia liuliyuniae TaxID=2911517 RepID=UPI003556229C
MKAANNVISPGGMRRDCDGFACTVRVRVIHAHVRVEDLYRLTSPGPGADDIEFVTALSSGEKLRVIAASGRDELVARGYRQRDIEMGRMRSAYDVRHQLVDDAPQA